MHTVLVTGGAGYVGSHTVLELLDKGYSVIVLDDLSNSSEESLRRVHTITGKPLLAFYKADICDAQTLRSIFQKYSIWAVIHFAGLKAVGESSCKPLHYYNVNVTGSLTLLAEMKRANVHRLVFSSSATVYGIPESVPCLETARLSCTNPYGRTKLFVEEMIRDVCSAPTTEETKDGKLHAVILRYFNPTGAHPSGLIGEDPSGPPNNLMPYVAQVASGRRPVVSVFGSDYPTRDGTGVRDFIHVCDLALGHLAALRKLADDPGCVVYNLGSGQGYSVLEMINAFRRASGTEIPVNFVDKRPGDVAECIADPQLAKIEMGWEAKRDLDAMCEDLWRWQSKNPNGYS